MAMAVLVMVPLLLLLALAATAAAPHPFLVDNTKPRTDENGDIVNAHQVYLTRLAPASTASRSSTASASSPRRTAASR